MSLNARYDHLTEQLNRHQQAGLQRKLLTLDSSQCAHIQLDGQHLLNFASNDYLGLANHPRLIRSMQLAANQWGAGSGSSHLVCGHNHVHQALEEELAAFIGYPRTLLLSTGYMANLGVISTLCDRHHYIFEDRLNHASLLDGALLSRATLRRYPHSDVAALADMCTAQSPDMIVTDGVFSMDGDIAPLAEIAKIADQQDSWLMVDDAHGIGIVGPNGQGSVAAAELSVQQAPIMIGTLGKSFGTFGAFVAGNDTLINALIQFCRPYIFTTALPSAICEAARTSLKLIQQEPERRVHLQALITKFQEGATQLGIPLLPSNTPIQPVLAGDNLTVMRWRDHLRQCGILVGAIRPPTVPANCARLRISITAAHRIEDIDLLLESLAALTKEPVIR